MGAMGVAYGSISIPDESAGLCCSQAETFLVYTRGPRKMENYKWNGLGWQFLFLHILFLFGHKFHLPQHRILVAEKGNTILLLMKKLINIHSLSNADMP